MEKIPRVFRWRSGNETGTEMPDINPGLPPRAIWSLYQIVFPQLRSFNLVSDEPYLTPRGFEYVLREVDKR